MKTIIFLLIGAITFSCSHSSRSGKMNRKEKLLLQINSYIAKENNCKLTTEYSDEKSNEITLTIGNKMQDPNLPGKILLEYFLYADTKNLKFLKFKLLDKNNRMIYQLTQDQLITISEICGAAKGIAIWIDEKQFQGVYDSFDKSVKEDLSVDEFKLQIVPLNLSNTVFSGFIISEGMIQVAFKNAENELQLVYKINDPEFRLFGFHVD